MLKYISENLQLISDNSNNENIIYRYVLLIMTGELHGLKFRYCSSYRANR